MKRILQFIIAACCVLVASFALADPAPATMTGDQLATQVLAQLPVWAQWMITILATVCGPAILAFLKSEKMALNDNTTANGILHYFQLANAALTSMPRPIEAPEPEAEPAAAGEASASNAAKIAELKAQLADLEGGAGA